jgi:hypothetical protein
VSRAEATNRSVPNRNHSIRLVDLTCQLLVSRVTGEVKPLVRFGVNRDLEKKCGVQSSSHDSAENFQRIREKSTNSAEFTTT